MSVANDIAAQAIAAARLTQDMAAVNAAMADLLSQLCNLL
jgi:Arc/MetJ family transcription regulator